MNREQGIAGLARALAALAVLCLACQAPAAPSGGLSEYRLPPGRATGEAAPQGPVDSDVPVVRPTSRLAAPPPAEAEPMRAEAVPEPRPTATPYPVRPRAEPAAPARPTPLASPAGEPAAPQLAPHPAASISLEAPPSVPAMPPAPSRSPATTSPGTWSGYAPWVGIGLALLLVLAGLSLSRRRADRPGPDESRVEPPAPAAPATAMRVPVSPSAEATPPAGESELLAIEFEARQFSRTLVYATLAYRLTLRNRGAAGTGPLAVAGDLASAHASLPSEAQLAPDPASLAFQHRHAGLAPGESVTIDGQLRLPVGAIVPIVHGSVLMYVPLARFRIERDGEARTRVYVVGEPGPGANGALRPLRVDGMPGSISLLGQREIALPG